MRLAKFLAHAGVASRRASEEVIRDGRVTVEGEIVLDPARGVEPGMDIRVDGRLLGTEEHVVYALHKPAGVVSTAKDTHGRPTVTSLVRAGARLYPVGRLDADSTGLILLTNDGELANQLQHPRFEVPKVYVAEVKGGFVQQRKLHQLRDGIVLEDGKTAPAKVRQLKPGVLEITIHEGRKHQVKRMCEAIGHPVVKLRREAFGPLRIGRLAEGASRKLTPREIGDLRSLAAGPKGGSRPARRPRRG